MEQFEVHQRLPRFGGDFTLTLKVRGQNQEQHYNYEGEIPRELMDAYQALIGDGKARVGFTADVSVKDFGTGASGSATVMLTCNQDQQTINAALALAAKTAQEAAAFFQPHGAQMVKQLEAQQRGGAPGRPTY